MSEFMRGEESLGTLHNLVGWFDAERTSYLSWARANDDEAAAERLRRQRETGEKPPAQKPTVETYEWSPIVELLAQLYELTQQEIHAIHTHQTKAAKRKAKITRYPVPRTAMSRAKRAASKQAMRRVEASLVFDDTPYGPGSTLVKHSKHPPSAGRFVPGQDQQRERAARPKPHQLRAPRSTRYGPVDQ